MNAYPNIESLRLLPEVEANSGATSLRVFSGRSKRESALQIARRLKTSINEQ